MSTEKEITLAFDLYGTLLSPESITKKLTEYAGKDKAAAIASSFRKYQLEYTWRLNSMNKFEPFSDITRRSLLHAAKESADLELESSAVDAIMKAYDSLSMFPDVEGALKTLSQTPGITAAVFSNGTQSMVTNSVHHSPDLSPYASLFRKIIVVEKVRKYKPAPEVYDMLAKELGKEKGDIWLVSGNPFDVVGARTMGMQAVWVDRSGAGWVDELIEGDEGKPTIVVQDLGQIVTEIRKFYAS